MVCMDLLKQLAVEITTPRFNFTDSVSALTLNKRCETIRFLWSDVRTGFGGISTTGYTAVARCEYLFAKIYVIFREKSQNLVCGNSTFDVKTAF
jgi:hypothetical protein